MCAPSSRSPPQAACFGIVRAPPRSCWPANPPDPRQRRLLFFQSRKVWRDAVPPRSISFVLPCERFALARQHKNKHRILRRKRERTMQRDDEFELYDLQVVVEAIEGNRTCAMQVGDRFFLRRGQ